MGLAFAVSTLSASAAVVAVGIPFFIISAADLQHASLNMGLFSIGLMNRYSVSEVGRLPFLLIVFLYNLNCYRLKCKPLKELDSAGTFVSWGNAVWYNLLPVALGNMASGILLVGCLMYYLHQHDTLARFVSVPVVPLVRFLGGVSVFCANVLTRNPLILFSHVETLSCIGKTIKSSGRLWRGSCRGSSNLVLESITENQTSENLTFFWGKNLTFLNLKNHVK
jgi:hypothetical protein